MKTYDKYLGPSAVFIFNSNLLLLGDKMVLGMTEAQIWPVKDEANNTHKPGLNKTTWPQALLRPGERSAPRRMFGDKTHLSLPHMCLHNTGSISYEGGDGECARGDNAAECVQMGKGPIHTLTHSWKPDCSSSAEARAYYSNHLK